MKIKAMESDGKRWKAIGSALRVLTIPAAAKVAAKVAILQSAHMQPPGTW